MSHTKLGFTPLPIPRHLTGENYQKLLAGGEATTEKLHAIHYQRYFTGMQKSVLENKHIDFHGVIGSYDKALEPKVTFHSLVGSQFRDTFKSIFTIKGKPVYKVGSNFVIGEEEEIHISENDTPKAKIKISKLKPKKEKKPMKKIDTNIRKIEFENSLLGIPREAGKDRVGVSMRMRLKRYEITPTTANYLLLTRAVKMYSELGGAIPGEYLRITKKHEIPLTENQKKEREKNILISENRPLYDNLETASQKLTDKKTNETIFNFLDAMRILNSRNLPIAKEYKSHPRINKQDISDFINGRLLQNMIDTPAKKTPVKKSPGNKDTPGGMSFDQFRIAFFPGCTMSETKEGDIYYTKRLASDYYRDYLKSKVSFKEYDEGMSL